MKKTMLLLITIFTLLLTGCSEDEHSYIPQFRDTEYIEYWQEKYPSAVYVRSGVSDKVEVGKYFYYIVFYTNGVTDTEYWVIYKLDYYTLEVIN